MLTTRKPSFALFIPHHTWTTSTNTPRTRPQRKYTVTRRRRRRQWKCAIKPPSRTNNINNDDNDEEEKDDVIDSYFRRPWDDPDSPGKDIPTEPLNPEQEESIRSRLPRKIAEFVIRRASRTNREAEAVKSRLERETSESIDEELEREYEEYVYETDNNVRESLFVREESEAEKEAKQAGYGVLAVLGLIVLVKVAASLVGFFVSFTFSFLAIFALSAGIFMVFVLFRF